MSGASEPQTARVSPGRVLLALGLAAVGALAFAALAAYASPRIKLLILFPIGLGMIAGYVTGAKLRAVGIRRRAVAVLLTAPVMLVLMSGYFGFSLHRYRAMRAGDFERSFKAQPDGERLWAWFRGDAQPKSSAEANLLNGYRNAYAARRFAPVEEFLRYRVTPADGRTLVPPPWHVVIAATEVLGAIVAGSYAASLCVGAADHRSETPTPEPHA